MRRPSRWRRSTPSGVRWPRSTPISRWHCDIVGLSYTEIADSLEITLATVKWRIFKAREEVQLALVREGVSVEFSGERAASLNA